MALNESFLAEEIDVSTERPSLAEKLAEKEKEQKEGVENKLEQINILPDFKDYFAEVKEKIEVYEQDPERALKEGNPSIDMSPEDFEKLMSQVSSREFADKLAGLAVTPEQKQGLKTFDQTKNILEEATKEKPGTMEGLNEIISDISNIDGLDGNSKVSLEQINTLTEKAKIAATETGKFFLARGIDIGCSYVPYVGEAKNIYEGLAGYSVTDWAMGLESELSTGERVWKILSGSYKLATKHVDFGITSNLLTAGESVATVIDTVTITADAAGQMG